MNNPLEVPEEPKFDLTVQHRDPKTGRVVLSDPYRLHCISNKQYFERPVGSGNLYWANNSPAGQIIWENEGKKKVVNEGMPHIEFTAPLTGDEKFQRAYESRGSKIQDLETKIIELEAKQIADEAVVVAKTEEVVAPKASIKKAPIKASVANKGI